MERIDVRRRPKTALIVSNIIIDFAGKMQDW
jgi:hypothetical protein